MKRREFIHRTLLASGAAYTAPWEQKISKGNLRRGKPKKVIIVGGGLAGLTAAYELMMAGHEVTLLEARDRPGGRIHTLRKPFDAGLYAEAGAMVIDRGSPVIDYCRLLDVALDPFHFDFSGIYHLGGESIAFSPESQVKWPFALTPEEAKMGMYGIREKYMAALPKTSVQPQAIGWRPDDSLKKYDDISLTQLIAQRGASPGALSLLRISDMFSDGGFSMDSSSALSAIVADATADLLHSAKVEGPFTIRGGSDRLPEAFAAKLGSRVLFNAPVIAIRHSDKDVKIVCQSEGTTKELKADRLILAIPFSVLRDIDINPKFSPGKQKAIRELPYAPTSRVYLQTKTKFWLGEGKSGYAVTDLPINNIFPTFSQQGNRGILESMISGQQALKVAAMKPEDRINFELQEMSKIFPAISSNMEKGTSFCWSNEEWSKGCVAYFKPGQMLSLLPYIAPSEGRVHFAGEHTQFNNGSLTAALESGRRTAREVSAAI